MSYYGSADELCQDLDLHLLVRAETSLAGSTRHERLSGYSADPIASGQLYHRVRDALGERRGTSGFRGSVLWLSGPSGAAEQLPWAVGLADQISRQGLRVYLVGEQLGARRGTTARCEELSQSIRQRLGESLPPDPVAVGTDVEGVRWIVSRTADMNAPVAAALDENWSVLFVDSLPEYGEPIPPHPTDGIVLVASFRDHSRSELGEIRQRLTPWTCLGAVPLGPATADPVLSVSPEKSRPGSLWDDSRRHQPVESEGPGRSRSDGKKASEETSTARNGDVTQTSWAALAVPGAHRDPVSSRSGDRGVDGMNAPPDSGADSIDGSPGNPASEPTEAPAPVVENTSWGDRVAARHGLQEPNVKFPKPKLPDSPIPTRPRRPRPSPVEPISLSTPLEPTVPSPVESTVPIPVDPISLSTPAEPAVPPPVESTTVPIPVEPISLSTTPEPTVVPPVEPTTVPRPVEPISLSRSPEKVPDSGRTPGIPTLQRHEMPPHDPAATNAPVPPADPASIPVAAGTPVIQEEGRFVSEPHPEPQPGWTDESEEELDPFEEATARRGLAGSTGAEVVPDISPQPQPQPQPRAPEDRTVALLTMWERENQRRSLPGRIFHRVLTSLLILGALAAAGWFGYRYWNAREVSETTGPTNALPTESESPRAEPAPSTTENGEGGAAETEAVLPPEARISSETPPKDDPERSTSGVDLTEVRERLERRRETAPVEYRVALPAAEAPSRQDAAPPVDPGADVASLTAGADQKAASEGTTPEQPASEQLAPKGTPSRDGTPPGEDGGGFVVHLSSFRLQAQAEREVERLREFGLDPEFVFAKVPNKGTWYRVFIGHFATFQQARDTAVQLQTEMDLGQVHVAGQGGKGKPVPVAAPALEPGRDAPGSGG